jgi:uncharacterized membrane protein
VALTFSAGMHAALVPEHLQEMPPLGWAFIVAAVIGAGLGLVMTTGPNGQSWARVAAVFLVGEIAAWILFVTVKVPGFMGTPEPVETIAVVCKVVELIGLGLALSLGWGSASRRVLVRSSASGRTAVEGA